MTWNLPLLVSYKQVNIDEKAEQNKQPFTGCLFC
jgi:hypothetical protein